MERKGTIVLLKTKRTGRRKAFSYEHAQKLLAMPNGGGWEPVEREPAPDQEAQNEPKDVGTSQGKGADKVARKKGRDSESDSATGAD